MTRATLLTLAALCALVANCASPFEVSKSHSITYDMAHNDFSVFPGGGLTVNEGDLVSFEVKNINPFMYDVTINQKSMGYPVEKPLPARYAFKGADLIDTVFQPGTLNVDIAGSVNRVPISRYRTLYSIFRSRYATFYSFLTFDEFLRIALRQAFVDEQKLKESLANHLSDVAGHTTLYTRSDFIHKGDELFDNLTKSYNDLASEYQFLDSLSKGELRDVNISARRAYDEIANKGTWAMRIGATADLYDAVLNTPFSFSSFKTQVTGGGDEMRFQINGRSKPGGDPVESLNARPFDLDYVVKVRGGWRIDFSAGLFASSLVNNVYSVRDSAGFKSIIQNDGDAVNYGPGALMHFYHKSFPVGGNLGLMLNNASRIQYTVGGSVLLGDNQRLCLNGGLTFGNVTTLAAGYTLNEKLTGTNASISAIPTVDRLKLGWFGGISYNFTASTKNQ